MPTGVFGHPRPRIPTSPPLRPPVRALPWPARARAKPGRHRALPLRGRPPRGQGAALRRRGEGRGGGDAGRGRCGPERGDPSGGHRGRHGVALYQPPLLPGAALEPAGPLRRGGAAHPARLFGPRERGAGPRRRRFPQGPVPCRRQGPWPGRATHSVPAGLRRVDGARGAQRCSAGARVECGRPQEQAPGSPWPGCLRAPHRRHGLGCGDHILQVWGFGQGSASSPDPMVGGNGGREP